MLNISVYLLLCITFHVGDILRVLSLLFVRYLLLILKLEHGALVGEKKRRLP